MFKKKKNKEKTPEPELLPGGIDPTSPDSRRANNVEEIKFEDLKLYFLIIKINKATDLKAADITLKGGSSDPFCEVIANKQKFSTKTIMENLNPVWDEETTFCFFNLVDKIEFKVWDWDKGSKHDAIGNCFLNTSRFYDKDNNGFEGDIKLENVKKGSINVSVQGRLIIPKELEIRCDNLTKLKADQLKIITDKQSELNKLETENKNLTNTKNDKENELSQLESRINNKTEEKEKLIEANVLLQTDIDNEISNIKNIDKEKEECNTKTTEMRNEIKECETNLEKEKERKEKIIEHMEELRNGALGSSIGKSIGKGFGMISKMGTSNDDDARSGGAGSTTSTTKPAPIKRSTSQDPEVGHMNVGWIRHNAPRESLVTYQHEKYPASRISITAKEKEAKRKAAGST